MTGLPQVQADVSRANRLCRLGVDCPRSAARRRRHRPRGLPAVHRARDEDVLLGAALPGATPHPDRLPSPARSRLRAGRSNRPRATPSSTGSRPGTRPASRRASTAIRPSGWSWTVRIAAEPGWARAGRQHLRQSAIRPSRRPGGSGRDVDRARASFSPVSSRRATRREREQDVLPKYNERCATLVGPYATCRSCAGDRDSP